MKIVLKIFLGKDYSKLFTIDLICHGVPSPKVWEKYLAKKSLKGKIKKWIDFLEKLIKMFVSFMNL